MNKNSTRIQPAHLCMVILVVFTARTLAGGNGVPIRPDAAGHFQYVEDFRTPKFFDHAFLSNVDRQSWERFKAAVVNAGPNQNRMLTYRFYSERIIEQVEIKVDQSANNSPLGGRNVLYVSANGMDWKLLASSEKQKADKDGWQNGPLTISSQQAAEFTGGTELWVRVSLDNAGGVKTETSNRVRLIEVNLTVGDKVGSQASLRAAWGELHRRADWKSISLSWADPIGHRPPHYYEDSDGWLQAPGANPNLDPDETDGFPVQRICYTRGFPDRDDPPARARSPLSLAMFVDTRDCVGPLMARIVVAGGEDRSRKMNVLWDGKLLAGFDSRSYFDRKIFFVELPVSKPDAVHELRIAGGDKYPILVKQITVAGGGRLGWVEKPALPAGGSLEVIGAYYMPDPQPPAGSQTVEGRHEKRPMGLIFRPLQRLYTEHAEFGALRVVVRNNSQVPVRIGWPIELNGKPIEQSYIDFGKSDWNRHGQVDNAWDARGVVWYRVRPRTLDPGRCGQVYIRFRRRPAGDKAKVKLHLENGPPVEATVKYTDPGLAIDYVATDKTQQTLYVYARLSPGAQLGKVAALRLNGKRVKGVKIYGADFPGNVALAVAKLPQPLKLHEYHIVGIETDAGATVDAQFRVMPFFFPRSSFYAREELYKPHNMNFVMGNFTFAIAEKYDLRTMVYERGIFKAHARTMLIYSPDEPDAQDWQGCRKGPPSGERNARGLGYHARVLAESGWQELIEHSAPHVASTLMLNGTTRPMNGYIYGQFADVLWRDPYPNLGYHGDHAYVGESLELGRLCARPGRVFACLEAFDWGPALGDDVKGRFPLPAEYCHDVVQAIGSGMKGLTSWVANWKETAGWRRNTALADEVTRLNTLIEHIDDKLLIGTPVDLAQSDAGMVLTGNTDEKKWPKPRVWVRALLCGPDTIVVAAVNHIPANVFEAPAIEPAKNVTITVRLPEFLRKIAAFEVTENGIAPFASNTGDGNVSLKLDAIESGRVFLLQRQ